MRLVSFLCIFAAGLGDERTRELNDEINKLLREKRHWERRIRDLGGKSYSREAVAVPMLGEEGAISHKGYFYFGAARNLPGVAALAEADRRGRGDLPGDGEFDSTPIEDLLRRVDPSRYYGYEDTELEALEKKREAADRKQLVANWESKEDAPSVMEGVAWEQEKWEGLVGKLPPNGDALETALKDLRLQEQKLEAMGILSNMAG